MNMTFLKAAPMVLTVAVGVAGISGVVQAAVQAASGPQINLFTPRIVEQLNETSKIARSMEHGMEAIVNEMDQQRQLHDSANCEGSNDPGCLKLRKNIRGKYQEMLQVLMEKIPDVRGPLADTKQALEGSIRTEIGRKATPGDIQRVLAGRPGRSNVFKVPESATARGNLSKTFSGWYDMIKRNKGRSAATPLLASQIYLDSQNALYYLELMEAEIGAQNTELVIDLEWGDLNDQMTTTVAQVKSLLWGDEDATREILNVGFEQVSARDSYGDLLLD